VVPKDLSVALTDKSIFTTDFNRCLKKLRVVETTDKISCDNGFVGQGNRKINLENRFWSVTKLSVGITPKTPKL
jgi:hypothetical protein